MAKQSRAKGANRPNPRVDRIGTPNVKKQRSNIIEVTFPQKPKKQKVEIVPRNLSQEDLLASLESDKKSITFAVGPAGTGKTMIATLFAVRALKAKQIDKIVITRPNVAVDDKDVGYLPGDIIKKMSPWLKPITDVMQDYFSMAEIEQMMVEEIIEAVPIAFIRGRTFKNSIVIVDEAQGTTANSLLSILTRIGENCKLIVTGDLAQSDRGSENGLKDFLDRMAGKNLPGVDIITFKRHEVQRHPVIKDILKLYGQD